MRLPLPALAFAVEGNFVAQRNPRHIDAEQLTPCVVSLCGSHLRLLVDYVLEVVDHSAVWYEFERACQMAVVELLGLVTEPALLPRPCEEFHGHRVNLTALERWTLKLQGEYVTRLICSKCVTCFVGHYLYVMLCAVEVCEYERGLVLGEARAVTAAGLARSAQHVEQLILEHKVDELLCFG